MAAQLIAAMTGEFDPTEYRDEYRAALEAVIEAKVEGREIAEPDEAPAGGQLVDLMAALEASVNAARTARANRDVEAAAEDGRRPAEAAVARPAPEEGRPRRRGRGAGRGPGAEAGPPQVRLTSGGPGRPPGPARSGPARVRAAERAGAPVSASRSGCAWPRQARTHNGA